MRNLLFPVSELCCLFSFIAIIRTSNIFAHFRVRICTNCLYQLFVPIACENFMIHLSLSSLPENIRILPAEMDLLADYLLNVSHNVMDKGQCLGLLHGFWMRFHSVSANNGPSNVVVGKSEFVNLRQKKTVRRTSNNIYSATLVCPEDLTSV